jgi:hypothetical protein
VASCLAGHRREGTAASSDDRRAPVGMVRVDETAGFELRVG